MGNRWSGDCVPLLAKLSTSANSAATCFLVRPYLTSLACGSFKARDWKESIEDEDNSFPGSVKRRRGGASLGNGREIPGPALSSPSETQRSSHSLERSGSNAVVLLLSLSSCSSFVPCILGPVLSVTSGKLELRSWSRVREIPDGCFPKALWSRPGSARYKYETSLSDSDSVSESPDGSAIRLPIMNSNSSI